MQLPSLSLLTALLAFSSASALPSDLKSLILRDNTLEPRAGGGGGRGGGGGGGSGGSSGGSSSSGGRGSSSSSGSGSTSGSSSSSSGSRGSPATYGSGGGVYAGGARAPYAAGSTSPGGIGSRPLIFGAGAVGGLSAGYLLATYPHGAYLYDLNNHVSYQNQSDNNQTVLAEVQCICAQYNPCGCDQNPDPGFVNSLIGNGSYATLQANNVTATIANGTLDHGRARDGTNGTLVIDGTLQNGTGTDDTSSGASTNMAAMKSLNMLALAAAVAVGIVLV